MKIYTEVNYEWINDELVKTSSKSFEYEGEVSLCVGGGGGGGGTQSDPTIITTDNVTTDVTDEAGEEAQEELDAAEDSINDTISDTNDEIEETIDENTDTFEDIEGGINDGIGTTNDLIDQGIEITHDVGGLALEGANALLDINNPNSLISSPVNWYEEAAGVGKGGWDPPFQDEIMGYSLGLFQSILPTGGGGGTGPGGSGDDDDDGTTTSNFAGLEGDPFGREGKERREIHEQKKFPQQIGQSAPSLVNQKRKT